MIMKLDELLETTYAPAFPELLSMYHIDIEYQDYDGIVWGGKLWKEVNTAEEYAYPFLAVSNAGEGGSNKYTLITSKEDREEFFEACRKCFPKEVEPQDYACVYLELRQAKQDEEMED